MKEAAALKGSAGAKTVFAAVAGAVCGAAESAGKARRIDQPVHGVVLDPVATDGARSLDAFQGESGCRIMRCMGW